MTIQRAWKEKLWRRQVADIIDLAQSFADLYAECKKTGDVLPSLDYDRKLLERGYGSPWKELRAAQRERDYWAREAARAGTEGFWDLEEFEVTF